MPANNPTTTVVKSCVRSNPKSERATKMSVSENPAITSAAAVLGLSADEVRKILSDEGTSEPSDDPTTGMGLVSMEESGVTNSEAPREDEMIEKIDEEVSELEEQASEQSGESESAEMEAVEDNPVLDVANFFAKNIASVVGHEAPIVDVDAPIEEVAPDLPIDPNYFAGAEYDLNSRLDALRAKVAEYEETSLGQIRVFEEALSEQMEGLRERIQKQMPAEQTAEAILSGLSDAAYFMMTSAFRDRAKQTHQNLLTIAKAVFRTAKMEIQVPSEDSIMTVLELTKLAKNTLEALAHISRELEGKTNLLNSRNNELDNLRNSLRIIKERETERAKWYNSNRERLERAEELEKENEVLRKELAMKTTRLKELAAAEARALGNTVKDIGASRYVAYSKAHGFLYMNREDKEVLWVKDIKKASWFSDLDKARILLSEKGIIGKELRKSLSVSINEEIENVLDGSSMSTKKDHEEMFGPVIIDLLTVEAYDSQEDTRIVVRHSMEDLDRLRKARVARKRQREEIEEEEAPKAKVKKTRKEKEPEEKVDPALLKKVPTRDKSKDIATRRRLLNRAKNQGW